MKKLILIAFLVCCALAQNNCPQQCDPQSPNNGCPPNSNCIQVNPTGSNQVYYACICRETYYPICSNNNGEYRFTCVQRNGTSTGCGPNYPDGCPTDQSCVGDTPSTRRCVCNDATAIFVNGVCVPQCPPYSSYNQETRRCECVSPYVQDPNSNSLRCIPGNPTSCEQISCPSGFTCRPPSNTFPYATCVPVAGVPICGVDYRCPDTQVCIDTPDGPVCRCREGFGGPNCAYRRCWLVDNNQQYGCWLPNMTADCVPTSTGEALCICRDGTAPPNCAAVDNRCANVDCSAIANSRCIEGVCRCIEGYTAVPSETPGRFVCQQVQQGCTLTCESNKRCAFINGQQQCVCPTDTFGGADCSRPACTSDEECADAGLANAFCVRNTQNNVNYFCACKPGYTGERCEIQINSCDPNECPWDNAVCNNERACACAPGFVRENGDCVPDPTVCTVLTLTLRARTNGGDFTPEELQALIALLLSIDVSNIEIQGPIRVEGTDRVQYLIRICGDENVDQDTATQDLVDKVNSGADGGIGIDSVEVGDQTTGSNSSGSALFVSVAVIALNFF